SNPDADASVLLARGIAPINWRRPEGFCFGVTLEADRRDRLTRGIFRRQNRADSTARCARCLRVATRPRCQRRTTLDSALDPRLQDSTVDSRLTLDSRLALDSRLPTDSRLTLDSRPTLSSRLPTDSRLPTPDSRLVPALPNGE